MKFSYFKYLSIDYKYPKKRPNGKFTINVIFSTELFLIGFVWYSHKAEFSFAIYIPFLYITFAISKRGLFKYA